MVGLDSDDCFALATYKINSAIEKQKQEGLPYFFAIVGVPNLTGASVGGDIPSFLIETVALIDQAPKGKSKRDIEDAVVESLVKNEPKFRKKFRPDPERGAGMCSLRGERINFFGSYFLNAYLRCECVGSHVFPRSRIGHAFSLSKDLIPLKQFLATLREGGPQRETTLMERGDY